MKKDGSLRLCIDHRALNNIAIKDAYHVPRINELLDIFSIAIMFSALNATNSTTNFQ